MHDLGTPVTSGRADRAELLARYPFPPDRFQVEAFDALDAGHHVVVAAPTGSGKTVVAEYGIETAVRDGRRAFYTAPIKALSNQKYRDLIDRHGADRVGLLTGDNSINGDADVVVMTTEVLRNMIYGRQRSLDDLGLVVLDEVHFLQDTYRGPVWEEVIIHLPVHVQLVCLSATVSNVHELAEWIGTVRGPTQAVVEHRRPVQLDNLYLVGDRTHDRIHLLPTFVDGRPNPDASRLDASAVRIVRGRGPQRSGPRGSGRRKLYTPGRVETVRLLDEREIAERALSPVDHVAQDLGGHHHDVGVAVDRVVTRQQADAIGAVDVHQVAELLVRQRLDRRGVEGPAAAAQRELHAVLRHHRLAAPGRRRDDHVLAVVEGVERLDLEPVGREGVAGQQVGAVGAHVPQSRSRGAQVPAAPAVTDDSPASARDRPRTSSQPTRTATKYRTVIGAARAMSDTGSPEGVITAATTNTITIA